MALKLADVLCISMWSTIPSPRRSLTDEGSQTQTEGSLMLFYWHIMLPVPNCLDQPLKTSNRISSQVEGLYFYSSHSLFTVLN